jgi:hypothetical protein
MIPPAIDTSDLVRCRELDEAWLVRSAGSRLDAARRAGRALHDRIVAAGAAQTVRTADIATFPYPTKFGLQGVASAPVPYLFLRNRMHLVEVAVDGRTVSILVNPTDAERSAAAPYFARLTKRFGRILGKVHNTVKSALEMWRVAPTAIDYVTFDHLHVQDLRGLLAPGIGGRAFLPNARLLVQRAELDTLARLHPLQAEWYIRDCLAGVPADRIVALDGDYTIGSGFALVRTPGHTAGNHTLVMVTARGAWTVSENGICLDAYVPGLSEIRGVAKHAREYDVECILNANTREASLDQYTSMVLEKTLASPMPERPELPQHLASSELVAHVLAPTLRPTLAIDPPT